MPESNEPEQLSEFAQRYLRLIEDDVERLVVAMHIRRWDEGYRKTVKQFEEYKRIAEITMHEPQKVIAMYRAKGLL